MLPVRNTAFLTGQITTGRIYLPIASIDIQRGYMFNVLSRRTHPRQVGECTRQPKKNSATQRLAITSNIRVVLILIGGANHDAQIRSVPLRRDVNDLAEDVMCIKNWCNGTTTPVQLKHFIRLACLLAGWCACSVTAATTASFFGAATGSVTQLSVTAKFTVRDADAGKNGNIYAALLAQGSLYFLERGGLWQRYSSGPFPVFSSGVIANQSLTLATSADWSEWPCGQVFVGYGTSDADLVQNQLFGAILKIPSNPKTRAAADCSASPDADITRFLRQSAFGPTFASIARVRQIGISAYIDEQFNTPISGYPAYPYADASPPAGCFIDRDNPKSPGNACAYEYYVPDKLKRAFFTNALTQSDQLRQRVALALSQIWVAAGGGWLYGQGDYQQLLMQNAFGNYREIMKAVTLSPFMGWYLDMVNNDKPNPTTGSQPNENYAREFLQLFTIGNVMLKPDGTPQLAANGQPVPSYGQAEVIGFSHVFTGWTYPINPNVPFSGDFYRPFYLRGSMIASAAHHDTGTKTLLNGVTLPAGQTAEQDLEAALDNVFNHPNVGPFIGRQLIQHLITGDPSPAYVARIATVFNDNGGGVRGDMKAVIKAILLDPEARGDSKSSTTYGKLKEPVYQMIEILRALNGPSDGDGPRWFADSLNQSIFYADSVFNFYPPDYLLPGAGTVAPTFAIYNTASVMDRINGLITLTGPGSAPGVTPSRPPGYPPDSFTTLPTSGTYLDWNLLATADDVNIAEAVIDFLNYLFLDGNMTPAMRSTLLQTAKTIPANPNHDRARGYLLMLFSSPQFQVQR